MFRLIFALVLLGSLGCAGPTSPFGSIELKSKNLDTFEIPNQILTNGNFGLHPMLTTYPREQILHKKFPLILKIYDPIKVAERPKLNVFYNNIDVSEKFLRKAEWRRVSDHELDLNFKNLKLSPLKLNKIRFVYTNVIGSQTALYEYSSPNCNWDKLDPILNTDNFTISNDLKLLIEKSSIEAKLNPNLVAGLIAQESGFDPKAVSVSKGIGLTQITPSAEAVVVEVFPHFPRFPDLNEFDPLKIKLLISLDHVTEQQEWRLNPSQSINGGIAYLNSVKDYWISFERSRVLASIDAHQYHETNEELMKLVLASYNSGFARVRNEVNIHQKNWMNSPQIQEAKKYVNLVSSYCSLFAQRQDYEN